MPVNPLLILLLAIAPLAAMWAFVHWHSRRDIAAHKQAERARIQYGESKFASPALRNVQRLPPLPPNSNWESSEIARQMCERGVQ